MKKNGIEVRPNGNEIRRHKVGHNFFTYDVFIKDSLGDFCKSANGPWDYIYNARDDADRERPKIPDAPQKSQVLSLLQKKHTSDVPNWTTKEQQEAFKVLKLLAFFWFRDEDFLK